MAQLRKILLVDDDDDLREALSEQLVMTEDFDVFEAGSGSEAMEKSNAWLYDLVILDVRDVELDHLVARPRSPVLDLDGDAQALAGRARRRRR